jgi:hypothetical protein
MRDGATVALALDFELRLEERCPDRVVVSVLLAPRGGRPVRIEGVALHLERRDGEHIGTEMVLPIAGELRQPMLSTVELRTGDDEVPGGARVVGTAWNGAEQTEAQIPTDPSTELEGHLRGRLPIDPSPDVLETFVLASAEERKRLALELPWIDQPRLPRVAGALEVVEHAEMLDQQEAVDEFVADLGLDEEGSAWLKDLLTEE